MMRSTAISFEHDLAIWGASWGFLDGAAHVEPAALTAELNENPLIAWDGTRVDLDASIVDGDRAPWWHALPYVTTALARDLLEMP